MGYDEQLCQREICLQAGAAGCAMPKPLLMPVIRPGVPEELERRREGCERVAERRGVSHPQSSEPMLGPREKEHIRRSLKTMPLEGELRRLNLNVLTFCDPSVSPEAEKRYDCKKE